MIDRACISLNNRCNFRCRYCHFNNKVNHDDDNKNSLNIEDIKIIINNLIFYVEKNNIMLFKLGIAGSGEPLLNFNEIKEIVEKIYNSRNKNNFKIYTITNGYLANDEVIDFSYDNKDIFQLCFSLDGDKEIHDKYRCSFDKVWSNIQLYKKKFGHMPQINATVTHYSVEKQNQLLQFFISEGIYKVNFSKIFGNINRDMNINDLEYQDFLDKAKNMGIESRQMVENEAYDCAKYGKLCGVGITNVYISKEGIYPCARFWKNYDFLLGSYNRDFFYIESQLKNFTQCPKYECYYEYYKGEKI